MKITQVTIDEISRLSSLGATLDDIAIVTKIGKGTLYDYLAIGSYVSDACQQGKSISDCATEAKVSESYAASARSIYEAIEHGTSSGRIRTLEALSVLAKGKGEGEPVPTILPNLNAIKLQLQLQGRLEYRNRIEDQKSELVSERNITPRLDATSLRTKANLLLSGDATNVLPNDTLTAMDSSVGSNGDGNE